MGRREWEEGTIKLPSNEWPAFKKKLRDSFNDGVAADLKTLEGLYADLRTKLKGVRHANANCAVLTALQELQPSSRQPGAFSWVVLGPEYKYPLKALTTYQAMMAVLRKVESTGILKLRKPLKKDLPYAKRDSTTYALDDGASITLDHQNETVTWAVSENKNACERARSTYMGKVLFEAFDKVKWKAGSGGGILGNDEYNEEAGRNGAGLGGSYLTHFYGPSGDEMYERAHGVHPITLRPSRR